MSLIDRIKSVLGIGESQTTDHEGPAAVTVEHEPEEEQTEPEIDPTPSEQPVESEADVADVIEEATESESTEDEVETKVTEDEEEPEDIAEPESTPEDPISVTEISGIGPKYSERLAEAGIESVSQLAEADSITLSEQTEIGQTRIEAWIEAAKNHHGED